MSDKVDKDKKTSSFKRQKYAGSQNLAKKWSQPKSQGLFVSCIRGKERRCIGEMFDLLEDYAEQMYPEATAEADSDEELSVEQELAMLRKEEGKKFTTTHTETECLAFFNMSDPYDPRAMSEKIVRDILNTKTSRTRYTMRLLPVHQACHASSLEEVKNVIRNQIEKNIPKFFNEKAPQDKVLKYKVDPQIRHHTDPLSRDLVIQFVGEAMDEYSKNSDVVLKADMSAPDILVLATAHKSTFGLCLVDGPLWLHEGRKFNLEQVGQAARKEDNAEA